MAPYASSPLDQNINMLDHDHCRIFPISENVLRKAIRILKTINY